MKDIFKNAELIRRYAADVGGVFELSDLKSIFPLMPAKVLYRRLGEMERAGLLKRFARGIYLAEKFEPAVLSQKLCPESYVSFERVLAKHMLIGTVPANELKAVKIGKRRLYASDELTIVHLGIDKELFFGFESEGGVNFATKEKALLDTLYFYVKGEKFFFDIHSDIDLKKIDAAVIKKYLKKYKNPKFVSFVKNYLDRA